MRPYLPQMLPLEKLDLSAPDLIATLGEANRALARYDSLLEQSPVSHLLIAPLIRREALLSSRIEGSQSTLNEVLRFGEDESFAERGEQRDDLNEIRNYVDALNLGEAELGYRRFSLNLLKTLHEVLLGHRSVRGRTKNPGRFRLDQNWIGLPGAGIEQASYVPPPPHVVIDFMENWERFSRSDWVDGPVQAAVMHAQFELIHPFDDGNGRLGRLLIPLFLYQKKVISRPNFYPSAYLARNRDAYVASLNRLGDENGDWHGWIAFFLRALIAQAEETTRKVGTITKCYEDLKRRVVDLTRSQFAVPLLDAMFERPVFKRASLEKKLAALEKPPTRPALHGLLQKLVRQKVLRVQVEGKGRRGTIYALEELMQLLEEDE